MVPKIGRSSGNLDKIVYLSVRLDLQPLGNMSDISKLTLLNTLHYNSPDISEAISPTPSSVYLPISAVVKHNFFSFVPKSVSKLAASI
jgi:hypothetical protein